MTVAVKKDDTDYPPWLKQLVDAPENIYYKGNYNEHVFDKCLAVVGSRKVTDYGESVVNSIVTDVVSFGITIISGFMYGVDCIAHEASVSSGGKTIAVLGYGIDRKHASYNMELAERIIESGGLMISEYPCDYPADKWTFPMRNRIIAGLSQAVLVVEAAKNSGSLITAEYARKYNRKVFAVPGQITSSVSEGTNSIIKSGDAEILTSSNDILNFFGLSANLDLGKKNVEKVVENIHKNYGLKESQIYAHLCAEPLTLDVICRKAEISAASAGYFLTKLELSGFIIEKEGRYFAS